MTPLPDRVVIVAILATIGLCFALVFWTVRLQPAEPPLRWRDGSVAVGREQGPTPLASRSSAAVAAAAAALPLSL